jgi:hypothetical protein
MNLQDASLLERTANNLDELIHASRKLGPLYTENPKLVADISRKSKWLRTALKAFQERFDAKKVD